MAKVVGVGGVFFRTKSPRDMAEWYSKWLGVPIDPEKPTWGASFQPSDVPSGGLQVWSPFEESTTYLDPSEKSFMFNLIVDDLEGALKQVAEGGAEGVGDIVDMEYGSFGWFMDPEGNKVELWQPKPLE